jgi:hypothetical protein
MVLTCRILAPGAGAGEMPSALNIRYPLIVAELWRRVPRPDHLSCARGNIFPAIFSSVIPARLDRLESDHWKGQDITLSNIR